MRFASLSRTSIALESKPTEKRSIHSPNCTSALDPTHVGQIRFVKLQALIRSHKGGERSVPHHFQRRAIGMAFDRRSVGAAPVINAP